MNNQEKKYIFYSIFTVLIGALIVSLLITTPYSSSNNNCTVTFHGLNGVPYLIKTTTGQTLTSGIFAPYNPAQINVVTGFNCNQNYTIFEHYYFYPNMNQSFSFKMSHTLNITAPI